MKKKQTFEQAMARLGAIISSLENENVPLEQSLKLFSEGAELVTFCDERLQEAQLTVEKLFPTDGDEQEAGDAD